MEGLLLKVLGSVVVWAITIPFVVAAVRSLRSGQPLEFRVRAMHSHPVRASVGRVGAALIGLAALAIAGSFALELARETGIVGDKPAQMRCVRARTAATVAWNDHAEELRRELAGATGARAEELAAAITALARVRDELRAHPGRAAEIAAAAPVALSPAYERAMLASHAAQDACAGHEP